MKQTPETKFLIKTLQGVLMILPQSKTFGVLKTRLECVNITNYSLPFVEESATEKSPELIQKELTDKFAKEARERDAILACLKQFEVQ